MANTDFWDTAPPTQKTYSQICTRFSSVPPANSLRDATTTSYSLCTIMQAFDTMKSELQRVALNKLRINAQMSAYGRNDCTSSSLCMLKHLQYIIVHTGKPKQKNTGSMTQEKLYGQPWKRNHYQQTKMSLISYSRFHRTYPSPVSIPLQQKWPPTCRCSTHILLLATDTKTSEITNVHIYHNTCWYIT